jgi:hypothetical protein
VASVYVCSPLTLVSAISILEQRQRHMLGSRKQHDALQPKQQERRQHSVPAALGVRHALSFSTEMLVVARRCSGLWIAPPATPEFPIPPDVAGLRCCSSCDPGFSAPPPVGVGSERATKGKAWSKLGRAGDGARELLPWMAPPGSQKNFDPGLALLITHPFSLPLPFLPARARACSL